MKNYTPKLISKLLFTVEVIIYKNIFFIIKVPENEK